MSTSDVLIAIFDVLCAASFFIFVYCALSDRHRNKSGKGPK